MHIGHSEDDMDHEILAFRHYGQGIFKERTGNLQEAMNKYLMANVLDPMDIAQTKIA